MEMKTITRQQLVKELVKNYGWSNLEAKPFAYISPIMILEDVVFIVNKMIEQDKQATNKDL
jgi:hypothetical protein